MGRKKSSVIRFSRSKKIGIGKVGFKGRLNLRNPKKSKLNFYYELP